MRVKDFYELSIPLVLDGGFATELETTHGKNLSTKLWSAACLYQDPESIREVHLSYFRAGADITSTCSYQASIAGFIKEGFTNQEAIELMQKSIHIAVEARDMFWKEYQSNKTKSDVERIKPMISLSFGPFGAALSNGSEYTGDYGTDISFEKLREFHKERLNIFKPLLSYVDFITFETIPLYLEVQSICSLLNEERFDIPCLISLSCENEEEISHGEPFVDCVQLCGKVDCVVGVGVNCIKPKYVEKLVKNARDELDKIGQEKKYVICYPNGSVEWDRERKGWKLYTEISLQEFENHVKIWAELGKFKVIIGGCCKTTPDHIRCVRNALQHHKMIT